MTQAPPQKSSSPILKLFCFGCVGLFLLGVLGCGGLFVMVTNMIRGSTPYKESLARVQQDQRVKDALGEPVEGGFWAGGQINLVNDGGNAEIAATLNGPQGTGVMEVRATKTQGKWSYQRIVVKIPAKQQEIDLLAGGGGGDGGGDAKPSDTPEAAPSDAGGDGGGGDGGDGGDAGDGGD